ncbi:MULTISPECIES: GNAT family N-acetyltransferase [unclassified Streptomyces]|uniref:GNAT family N-acetyltransferase n=1 Tax=unclassified Streptomyces TaxID=2593676 RepID=UPI00109E6D3E|nr:GNAT family N-acetyltransferase [Streptomyces sp. A1136]THA55715.1 GNAT family N-acetyltransferase [Streptomyces sp. A1136]
MSADIRPIAEPELREWMQTMHTGFLMASRVTDADVARRAEHGDLARTQGGFDSDTGRCVSTFRSFTQRLTVPGGAAVPATAVTNVTVLPTHRRQGLLTRMMAAELAAARDRGDVVATLIAAEFPIYGRYGFGPAASTCEWEIDVPRSGLDPHRSVPADGGRIDLVDGAEVRRVGPALHERLRERTHGAVDRNARWWDLLTGADEMSSAPYREKFFAVYRAADGEAAGLVAYRADDRWTDAKTPKNTLRVQDLIALSPAAERVLWHFLCSVDWVQKVRTGYRAPDDLLPRLLPDPRAARLVTAADFLWVRVLDVVRALGARTYAVPGVLVLDVTDPAGLSEGRYRLDAGTGECARTGEPADLRLDVATLGSLYLGDESAVRLAALGLVEEERPGALALADAVFRTARRPWCPDMF